MKLSLVIFISLFSLSLWAESDEKNKSSTAQKPLSIVTSIKPLTLLVKQIMANTDASVYQLLPGGSSPHHYQLNIAGRQKLQDADIVVWIGPDLETFLAKPLRQRKSRLITASHLDDIHWVAANHDHHDHHEEVKEAHHPHDRDPHLWLDPYNLGILTKAITAELIKINPNNGAIYQENSNEVLRDLAALDESLQTQLKPIASIPFIVMHPAYGHFVDRYRLNQQDYMVATPERGIGAKHLYQLKKLKPKCVFGEKGENTKLSKKIASSTASTYAELDPLGFELSENAAAVSVIKQLASSMSTCLSAP